jgi:hypothetical protein
MWDCHDIDNRRAYDHVGTTNNNHDNNAAMRKH